MKYNLRCCSNIDCVDITCSSKTILCQCFKENKHSKPNRRKLEAIPMYHLIRAFIIEKNCDIVDLQRKQFIQEGQLQIKAQVLVVAQWHVRTARGKKGREIQTSQTIAWRARRPLYHVTLPSKRHLSKDNSGPPEVTSASSDSYPLLLSSITSSSSLFRDFLLLKHVLSFFSFLCFLWAFTWADQVVLRPK